MKLFGNFETLEELHSPINSRVFRSREHESQREALVHVFPQSTLSAASKRRLSVELERAAELSHPSINSILELGEQDGSLFAAVEVCEGEDLKQFLARRGTLTVEAKVQIMSQVCDGLAFAHENGLIHRGIDPSAIIISKSGTAKIVNFGLTAANSSHASPSYLAPEQLRYQRGDGRTDVFCAALVFFELLTGKPPFSRQDIIHEILHETAPSITELNPDLPPRLANAIGKALSKDPAHRYQTAAEFGEDIRTASLSAVGAAYDRPVLLESTKNARSQTTPTAEPGPALGAVHTRPVLLESTKNAQSQTTPTAEPGPALGAVHTRPVLLESTKNAQ